MLINVHLQWSVLLFLEHWLIVIHITLLQPTIRPESRGLSGMFIMCWLYIPLNPLEDKLNPHFLLGNPNISTYFSFHIVNTFTYIYIYEQGPPHPPPPPARWFPPPPCGRGGGVFSAAKPIVAGENHGVCSLYSAYSAYVSIIRMDILYVI